MTTRRQASSPGKMPLLSGLYADTGEQAQFEDFRRRHSKQNRDIVRENANRLMLNKALQEEIVKLHRELLVVRQTTASMALKIKSLEDEMAQLRSEPSRQAIDAILSAVPALRQLQAALALSPPSDQTTSVSLSPPKVTPWPEKPALVHHTHLEALTERTEIETESESEREAASPPRGAKRRESGFIRIPSFSPDPELMDVVDTGRERVKERGRDEEGEVEGIVMDTVEEESEGTKSEPSVRTSPKEAAAKAPISVIRTKERFTPAKKPSEPDQTTPSSKTPPADKLLKPARTASASASTASSERRRISSIRKPDPAASASGSKAQADEVGVRRAEPMIDRAIARLVKAKEQEAAGPLETGSMKRPTPTSVPLVTLNASSAPPPPPELVAEGPIDDDANARGGRTGRARKSVNYKEPSLHKKMRKPDSEEEGDSAPTSSASMRRKSVLPRSRMPAPAPAPAPPLPSAQEASQAIKKHRESGTQNETVRKLLGLDDAL